MKLNLKTVSLSVLLAMGASSAFAHSNHCDVDMKYDIHIDGKAISLSEDKKEYVRIDSSNNLYLKGERQDLSGRQKELLADYADEVREFLPVVNDIAVEASALALEAVADVSQTLLSNSPDAANKIQARVETIANDLRAHVSNNHLYSQKLESYIEDSEFEEEIEGLVREVVADLVQGNIGTMIAAAIRGDEAEIKAFEERMEKFGKDMEDKYERKAEEIEHKAEKLCELVEQMDEKEDLFIEEFAEYKPYQLVKAD
ncbi:MAG: DUF2884 family protein [Gammaproteobacteria bacterium]|nr:DUF2884 family protein [Gammaproteobacteria bacterium]